MAVKMDGSSPPSTASAQLSTACTSTLISTLTPWLNFLTGSTNGGGSPTQGCCTSLSSLISSSTDCACLILTGGVPVSLPINRQLAITLPKLCNSKAVPISCRASASTLPSSGPVAYAPTLPALPPFCKLFNGFNCMNDPRSTRAEKLYFINFEYGSYNYRGYDIADHFNEYAAIHVKASPIEFDYLTYFFLTSSTKKGITLCALT